MQAFKHPNVMSLIGLCENFCGGPAIVMPFMANGSVLDYLRRERKSLVLSAEAEESMVCTLKTVQQLDPFSVTLTRLRSDAMSGASLQ